MKLTHFALTGLALALAAGVYLTLNADMDGRMEKMQAANDKQWQELQKSLKDLKTQPDVKSQVKEAVDAAVARMKPAAEEALNNGAQKVKSAAQDAVDAAVAKGEELANAARQAKMNEIRTGSTTTGGVQPEPPNLDDPNPDPEAAIIEREKQNILNSTGVGADRIALEAAAAANALPEGKAMNQLQSLIASQPAIARVKQADRRGDEFVVLDAGMNAKLMRGDRFAVRRGTAIIARIAIGDTIRATESVADVLPNTLVTGMVLEPGDEVIKFDR